MLRKPDPAVLVAITKEPPGRLQTRSIQVLDYNLNRYVFIFWLAFTWRVYSKRIFLRGYPLVIGWLCASHSSRPANKHRRFDIDDRKGLEIVILTALLTFQDLNETYHTPPTPPAESNTMLAAAPSPGLAGRLGLSRQSSQILSAPPPPTVPPKPQPRTGMNRVAEMHAVRTAQGEGDANEIEVGEECSVDDYAQYAERLLNVSTPVFSVPGYADCPALG